MCNLCRYARFSQAQSQIGMDNFIFSDNNQYRPIFTANNNQRSNNRQLSWQIISQFCAYLGTVDMFESVYSKIEWKQKP